MPSYCFVEGCNSSKYKGQGVNRSEEQQTFFGFPTNPDDYRKWEAALLLKNKQVIKGQLSKCAKICTKHFTRNVINKIGLCTPRLKPGAIPTLFPNQKNLSSREHVEDLETSGVHPSGVKYLKVEDPLVETSGMDKPQTQTSAMQLSGMDSPQVATLDMELADVENPHAQTSRQSTPEGQLSVGNKFVKIRYAGDITEDLLNQMSRESLVKCILKLKDTIKSKNAEIARLRRSKKNKKKKIESLEALAKNLRKHNFISSNSEEVLQTMAEEKNLVKWIETGKINGKYPPALRAFALTLNFYSPKAYAFVRKTYENKLPAASTMRSWYSHTDGRPGLTEEAVQALINKTITSDVIGSARSETSPILE